MALALQWLFLGYFLAISACYLALNYIALYAIIGYMRDHRAEYLPKSLTTYQPPVSILIPAHNEHGTIVSSVRSLLRLNYPQYEIIVVNDGSTDHTLQAVIDAFGMVEFPEAYRRRVPTKAVHRIYASARFPQVRLIDKDNGGKADALNAGINCARFPMVCCVDADCILQPDSLHRVVRPFLEDPKTVAVGGVIRVLNGCTVHKGTLEKVELPKTLLPTLQLVEYLRAFLFGRLGWSPLNALLVISGAFGVFYKERVIAIGGYRSGTVGEDMDLVVRLHMNLRKEGRPYRITFVPDPICWTEAPHDLKSLKNQRMRWQRGLAECLAPNLRFMFSRKSGSVGWLAFPFMLIFEMVGPLIEVTGYVATIVLWALGLIPVEAFLVFLFVSIGIGMLLSVNALFLEELSFHMYPRLGQQMRLFAVAFIENFGYRQINSLWRAAAMIQWMFSFWREARWGKITRSGAWQRPAESPPMAVAPGEAGGSKES
ncbi:MAG TPA: glycosyltransferase [Verrucomicrobiae bacterium]|nr:glycosyltransferase [Verrucomicrobiae bacterium]